MRVAIYFTPAQDDRLTRAAVDWLGRDAFAAGRPETAGSTPVAHPRRYGFHATLKAPFRLAQGQTLADLDAALSRFASDHGTVSVGHMILSRIDGFLALVPKRAPAKLAELEDEVRTRFEPYRAALTDAEYARRKPDDLTPRQRENLLRWGYPHVAEDFRFHMTLTDRLADADAAVVAAELEERFATALSEPLVLDALALFVEPQPGAPFHVHSRHALVAPASTQA